ncbi:MAG TPA: transcriptional regulator, partial [Arthrobacter bacterium]|nr:transcriptional regulator [Arthrobacter sp.]
MGRARDNREYGADASAGTGPVSRHADATAVGVARHLGSRRRMPVWLKITTAVLTVLVVGGLGFAGYWYFRFQSNITTAPLSAGEGAG